MRKWLWRISIGAVLGSLADTPAPPPPAWMGRAGGPAPRPLVASHPSADSLDRLGGPIGQ